MTYDENMMADEEPEEGLASTKEEEEKQANDERQEEEEKLEAGAGEGEDGYPSPEEDRSSIKEENEEQHPNEEPPEEEENLEPGADEGEDEATKGEEEAVAEVKGEEEADAPPTETAAEDEGEITKPEEEGEGGEGGEGADGEGADEEGQEREEGQIEGADGEVAVDQTEEGAHEERSSTLEKVEELQQVVEEGDDGGRGQAEEEVEGEEGEDEDEEEVQDAEQPRKSKRAIRKIANKSKVPLFIDPDAEEQYGGRESEVITDTDNLTKLSPLSVIQEDQAQQAFAPRRRSRDAEYYEKYRLSNGGVGDRQSIGGVVEAASAKPVVDREELVKKLAEAKKAKRELQRRDEFVQLRLADLLSKRKASRDYPERSFVDFDLKYHRLIGQIEELRMYYIKEDERWSSQKQHAKDISMPLKRNADMERKKFLEYKKQVAFNSVDRQSGKPVPPKDVEMAALKEEMKDKDVIHVRLENIRLKNLLKKQEQELKKREEFAEGLHLFDFELLKIENEMCNEKIEERNEELHKLRRKNSSTIQILSHLKEKLKSVQTNNLEKKTSLKEVEAGMGQSRQALSRTKDARDILRQANRKLRHESGMMGYPGMLLDLEEGVDEKHALAFRLEKLKSVHAALTKECVRLKQNIDAKVRRNRSMYTPKQAF